MFEIRKELSNNEEMFDRTFVASDLRTSVRLRTGCALGNNTAHGR
jgi:hypothetical protein